MEGTHCESQGRNISHTSGTEVAGQAQMRNDENMHQGSKNTGQDTNFLQQTGEGVNTMAQGAVHGAASIVQEAATGVANMAGGAASAVKNTLGAKNDDNHHHQLPGQTQVIGFEVLFLALLELVSFFFFRV